MASKYSAPLREHMSHWAVVPAAFCSFTSASEAFGADVHLDAGLGFERLSKQPGLVLLDDAAVARHVDRLRLRMRRCASEPCRGGDRNPRQRTFQELASIHAAASPVDLGRFEVGHEAPVLFALQ